MNLTRRIVLTVLALAVSMAVVSTAVADVKVTGSAGNYTSRMKFKIENQYPCGAEIVDPLTVGNTWQAAHFCAGTPGNYAVGLARVENFGAGPITACAWALGDAQAGGDNQIETVPDSVIACVGLYKASGGNALVPQTTTYAPGTGSPDSLLRWNVTRTATNVQLSVPTIVVGGVSVGSGGMQVRSANPNETTIAEFRLIVYPNQAAADGDINTDGFGSSFFGKAVLETGQGVPTGLSVYGGFSASDFIVQDQGSGRYTLRPVAGLTKNASVPDGNAAVVVMFADPRSIERPVAVPASTPVGLGLLTLALMASGLWVMRSRRKVETV